jgi:hypothetical protein
MKVGEPQFAVVPPRSLEETEVSNYLCELSGHPFLHYLQDST